MMGSGDSMRDWNMGRNDFGNSQPTSHTLEEGPPGLTGPWTNIGGPTSYAKIREQLAKIAMAGKKDHSYRILDSDGSVTNVYDPVNDANRKWLR